MTASSDAPHLPSPRSRALCAGLVALALGTAMLVACLVPFSYPSSSILYKFGADRTLLRMGKVCGILAACLLLLQLLLASRLKLLDRIFSLNRLLQLHRASAAALAFCALAHPMLVFAPEDVAAIPVKLEYWPEILGAGLLALIWLTAATALWRSFLELAFPRWRLAHRAAAVLLASGLVVHVLYVSGSFESGPPRAGLLLAAGLFGALWLWIRIRPLVLRSRGYEVKSVRRAGGETYTIELRPDGGRPLRHAPGQFAFLRFRSAFLSPEEHPFTIASPPDRPLSFTIRCSGDWTGDIWRLAPGVRAAVQGPYGLFSHLAHPGNRDLAMIAGGVGITPMLSMLRYMQDRGEDRKATLVWSNRTRRDILCLEEIGELADSLPGLTVIHVLTRERFEGMEHGRLDRGRLSRHLQGCSRGCLVFLCGPPAMMRQVRSDLRALGFSRRRIISEEFRL